MRISLHIQTKTLSWISRSLTDSFRCATPYLKSAYQTGCSHQSRLFLGTLLKYKVTLLKQGSAADVFLGNFRLFWPNSFTKIPVNDWFETMFNYLVSQIIIASAGQLSRCNRKNTATAFRILVKPHKPISKFTTKYKILQL